MKKNDGKYEVVKTLPKNALTVKEFADKNKFSTSYIYKLVREQKAKFRIVTFQTINFIIP
jgi:predicted transcriptional regulator